MTQEDKQLLLIDLCGRLPYVVKVKCPSDDEPYTLLSINWNKEIAVIGFVVDGMYATCKQMLVDVKPYLRPMSSMTEEEKKDLLITIVGNKGSKYFRVLQDGSIDNTDETIQDLNKFNMHWVNFDKDTVTLYLDWLNQHHFDYRGLIQKGLAISTEEFNPYKD